MSLPNQLVLASTSPYRCQLLNNLQLPFSALAPSCDETIVAGETPASRAGRLSRQKAQSLAKDHPEALVIGSDQVAHLEETIFRKPGNRESAIDQLAQSSDRWVTFTTGVCVAWGAGVKTETECYRVKFRSLSRAQIEAYVDLDEPYDCAGSLKAEGLGITLLADSEGRDINCLYGLPLMRLCDLIESVTGSPVSALRTHLITNSWH